jgi:hypothetical protein
VIVTGLLASNELSDEGQAQPWFRPLGRLAGRRYFTAAGWRYKNLSLVLQALTLVFGIYWVWSA